MIVESQNTTLMESILDKILAYQSRQASGPGDVMVMLGMVNLFGIISVMNRQAGAAAGPAAMNRQGGSDPLLTTLLTTLMSQRMQGGPDQEVNNPGGAGLHPALLMSLLGNQGQRPEQALLVNLLTGMMNNPRPAGPPPPQARRQHGNTGPGPAEGVKSYGVAEPVAKPDHAGAENARAPDIRAEQPAPGESGGGGSGPPVNANYEPGAGLKQENAPGAGGGVLVWDKRLG